jgi:glycerophosphoryl diester phosphodiesterase
VADAHASGLAVHVWTINDAPRRPTMEWLIDLGVDGIMTDRRSLLERVFGS